MILAICIVSFIIAVGCPRSHLWKGKLSKRRPLTETLLIRLYLGISWVVFVFIDERVTGFCALILAILYGDDWLNGGSDPKWKRKLKESASKWKRNLKPIQQVIS